MSSIGAVGGVSAAKRVETATGGRRKGVQRRGPFGERARFESSGDCLPTRILKSRIFKKHPAARFSPLTRLRSLDANIRICTHVYSHARAYVCICIYLCARCMRVMRMRACVCTSLLHYTHLSCISVNALSYTSPSTEKFDHFSPFFFHTYRNTGGMPSYISYAVFLPRLVDAKL